MSSGLQNRCSTTELTRQTLIYEHVRRVGVVGERSQVLERHRTESRHNVLARDLGIAVMGSWRYTGLNIGQPAFEKRSERFFGGLNVTAGFKLVDESHST